MKLADIRSIGVLGAGIMGGGTAQCAILAAVRKEALKIVEEGVGTKEDVNLAMTLGFRWPAGAFPQGPNARSGWK